MASSDYPAVELTKVKRHITLVRLPYANIYSVYGKLPKNREVRPPLGLLYVAGALEEAGHTVNIIDCESQLYPPEVTLQMILPDIVGFTATTPEIDGVESLAKSLKAANADIKIMVGGSHVSALPRQTMEDCPYLDYIVVGEGELSAVHIANIANDSCRIASLSEPITKKPSMPIPCPPDICSTTTSTNTRGRVGVW